MTMHFCDDRSLMYKDRLWVLLHVEGALYTLSGSSSSPSSYSHFYVGLMYDDIHLRVARSYTSSVDSPFSLMSLNG